MLKGSIMLGQFDWAIDIYDCITYTKPVVDPMQQKLTITVAEYIDVMKSFKNIKAGPDIIVHTGSFSTQVKEKVIEEIIAAPGLKTTNIEVLKENLSPEWIQVKKK